MGVIQLTRAGLARFQAELEDLTINKRKQIAEALKEAMGFGDLSENAEYEAARIAQSELEAKIINLQDKLSRVEIVDIDDTDLSAIKIGLRAKVLEDGIEKVYTLVGSGECDIDNNKITIDSPVGKSLLNKVIGDTVEVIIPDGVALYNVMEILPSVDM